MKRYRYKFIASLLAAASALLVAAPTAHASDADALQTPLSVAVVPLDTLDQLVPLKWSIVPALPATHSARRRESLAAVVLAAAGSSRDSLRRRAGAVAETNGTPVT